MCASPLTQVTSAQYTYYCLCSWVHVLLLMQKVYTLEGVTEGILLVFYCILFFMLLFHQVTGIITFSGMPYNASPPTPFFPLLFVSLFCFGFGFFFLTDLFLGKSFVSWLAARVFVCVFRSFVWGLVG